MITYEICGTGPDLLLLHGLSAYGRAWAELGYVEHFSRHYRVIYVDFPGHGKSHAPADPQAYTLEKVLSEVSGVLDELRSHEPAVVGFSYGGRVAMHLSGMRELRRVVALGTRFGPAMSRSRCESICAEWSRRNLQAFLACTQAFGDWPELTPAEVHAKTLFAVGDRDDERFLPFQDWQNEIKMNPCLQPLILEGVDHAQTFFEPHHVLPSIDAFLSEDLSG